MSSHAPPTQADAKWGEQVAAFIRPAPGQAPDPAELFAYCREHLAPHKAPRYWTVLEQFPLTPSGKIQKFMLRERFLAQGADIAIRAGSTDATAAAPPDPAAPAPDGRDAGIAV